jgi:hypothetical protein
VVSSNVTGLEVTLGVLSGRLPPDAGALVALARGLAVAVDADPSNAALWREYRQALVALAEVAAGEPDDEAGRLLAAVITPLRPKVGDAPVA